MRFRRWLILVAALLAGAPAAAQQPATADPVLNPGDAVRINVWRKPELSGDFTVGSNGAPVHPLYRQVVVTGVPLTTVEDRLRAFLRQFEQNPELSVQPLLRVAIGGEVRRPDLFTLTPEITVAQAVAAAGGPTERARTTEGRLLRRGQEFRLDLTRPDVGVAAQPIQAGDQILIPRRVSIFRDYIAPAGGLIGAAVSLIGILTR
jgi:protein involved in polysaccharide export with SLBB domain